MELPAEVLIHNELLGLKGSRGYLVRVSPEGYYEANISFGENTHRVLLPIGGTIVISREPETQIHADFEVER